MALIPVQRRRADVDAHVPGLRLALVAHVLIRVFTLAVLYVAEHVTGSSAHHALTRWDAAWYRRIAENGYGHVLVAPDGRQLSDYAFFPLYPAAERVVSAVTGLSAVHAGLAISALSSIIAAAGIYRVGECLHDAKTGVILVCLWSSLPVSVVQSMAYTESLFTAFAAWSLYALLVQRFVLAGSMAALAGLTRPLGAAVIAAVLGAAVTRLVSTRGKPRCTTLGASAVRDPVLGAMLAPLGLVAYLAFVGWSERRPLAYFDLAESWGNGVDGGQRFVAWTVTMIGSSQFVLGVALFLGLGLLGVAVWHTASRGYPWPVFVYTSTAVLMSLSTSGYFGSRPRYLLPVFTLLLWPALQAARLKPLRLVVALSGLAVTSAIYGVVWLFGPGPP